MRLVNACLQSLWYEKTVVEIYYCHGLKGPDPARHISTILLSKAIVIEAIGRCGNLQHTTFVTLILSPIIVRISFSEYGDPKVHAPPYSFSNLGEVISVVFLSWKLGRKITNRIT